MDIDELRLLAGSLRDWQLKKPEASAPANVIGVDDGYLVVKSNTGLLRPVALIDGNPQLYAFTTHKFFTNLMGQTGPTLGQLRTLYTTPQANLFKNDTSLFSVSAGIQKWTVPISGVYNIVAIASAYLGGIPYRVQGRIALKRGDVLNILCGQYGNPTSSSCGDGGTFVESVAEGLLLVAGAPGGGIVNRGTRPSGRGPATGASTGGVGVNSGGYLAGGGGGYSADGRGGLVTARSFKNGGVGGQSSLNSGNNVGFQYGYGGFGGGGGGIRATTANNNSWVIGGGGGYQGGDAAVNTVANATTPVGQGGSSYISTKMTNTANAQMPVRLTGEAYFGEVTVTLISAT